MAPVGILWGTPRQRHTKIIRSIAALNDLELEQPEWTYPEKPAAFLSKFPYGKIPAFEGSDGFTLTESTTIARYLSGLGTKVNLLGSNAREIALVDQWIHFSEHETGVPAYNAVSMIYGLDGPFNREALDKQIERLDRALAYIESYLATCPSGYLVSDSVTLADLVLVGIVQGCSHTVLGAAERTKYPLVFAHYARVTGHDKVKEFWGTAGFTEVALREPKTISRS